MRPRTALFPRAILAGFVGGLLGGLTMNGFTRIVAVATGGREVAGAAPGRRRVGRGMQPPQSKSSAEQDAAVRLASAVYRGITGRAPNRARALQLGVLAHYAFSAAAGVSYALVADRLPLIRRARGCVYGTLVWAFADEGVVPALGLSRGPRALTPGMHLYSLLGHWVYGATLERVRRAAAHSR